LTEIQLLHCTETKIFNIYLKFQPIQHESVGQRCKISLLKNSDVLPNSCEAEIMIITKSVNYKLKYANIRIYTILQMIH